MNSDIKKRIREIRNYYNLNQREFSKRIDVGQSTLAMFETGDREPKDIHINRICSEFKINKEWLCNGTGEMFVQIPELDEEAEYIEELLMNADDVVYKAIKSFLKTYYKLDDISKQVMRNVISDFIDNMKKEQD